MPEQGVCAHPPQVTLHGEAAGERGGRHRGAEEKPGVHGFSAGGRVHRRDSVRDPCTGKTRGRHGDGGGGETGGRRQRPETGPKQGGRAVAGNTTEAKGWRSRRSCRDRDKHRHQREKTFQSWEGPERSCSPNPLARAESLQACAAQHGSRWSHVAVEPECEPRHGCVCNAHAGFQTLRKRN